MKFTNTFYLLFFVNYLWSQSYSLTSYQDSYSELTDFSSMLLTTGDPSWDFTFPLDFDFPYFDSTYTELKCSFLGSCFVLNPQMDARIRLLEFGYNMDRVDDISEIQNASDLNSDVRFASTVKDGLKAFVLQYTRVRLISDSNIEEFDNYINFQQWYFEDGSIELRFGEYNFENSENYIPGEGFYLLPGNAPPVRIGPWIGLQNPADEYDILGTTGDYIDLEIVSESRKPLYTLPPPGWVIRFENLIISGLEIENQIDLNLSPNPVNNVINLNGNSTLDKIEIYNLMGNKVYSLIRPSELINVDFLQAGTYVLKVFHNGINKTYKFIKI